MSEKPRTTTNLRRFLRTAGAGFGAAGVLLASEGEAAARPMTGKEKQDRIASNTWPIR